MKCSLTSIVVFGFFLSLCTSGKSQEEAVVNDPTAPRITLLTAGTEPRRALRYNVRVGDESSFSLMTTTAVSGPMGRVSVPSQTQHCSTRITAVEGDDVSFVMTFGATEIGPGDPNVVAAMQTATKAMEGIETQGVITRRGLSKSMKMDLTKLKDPLLKSQLESVAKALGQISTLMPEEAVGLGANWRQELRLQVSGMFLDQVTEFEVIEMTDHSATLAVKVTQTAPEQVAQLPGMPAGAKTVIKKMEATGGGTVTFHTNLITPLEAHSEVTNAAVMEITLGGQTQEFSTDAEIEITLKSKPVESPQ